MAHTEALFREVNERIAETAWRLDLENAQFICECADSSCTTRVEATMDEYEGVREDADKFLLAPGHEDARVEAVVEREGDHAVVQKLHPLVRSLVVALDPRSP